MFFFDDIQGIIDNPLGDGLLSALHDHIDELCNQKIPVPRVRIDQSFLRASSSHDFLVSFFGVFAPYLERDFVRSATPAASSFPRTI